MVTSQTLTIPVYELCRDQEATAQGQRAFSPSLPAPRASQRTVLAVEVCSRAEARRLSGVQAGHS